MPIEKLFALLDSWVEHGWLRALDLAFARFLHERDPASPDMVLLAAALVSHQLGRGHICLDLQETLAHPEDTLSLPPEEMREDTSPAAPSEILQDVSPEELTDRLRASGLVDQAEGMAPLVLDSGRLYLRRYWRYTRQVAHAILRRLENGAGGERHAGPAMPLPDDLSGRLDQLFAKLRNRAERDKTEVHWQSVAAAIAAGSAFCVISGGPGTGKTTTVVQLLGLLQGLARARGEHLRILLAAPTGKAAARLTESIGSAVRKLPADVQNAIPSKVTTLHRLLGGRPDTRHFIYHQGNPLHVDLLVVDEASMIDLEMMAALLEAMPDAARLILLGDRDQLASVEAGSVLGDLCRRAGHGDDSFRDTSGYSENTIRFIRHHTGYDLRPYGGNGSRLNQQTVVLRKSHRFGEHSGIGALARAVNTGSPDAVGKVLQKGYDDIACLQLRRTEDSPFSGLVLDGHPLAFSGHDTGAKSRAVGFRAYLQLIKAGPFAHASEAAWIKAVLDAFGRFQLLAALRKGPWGVEGLNQKTADILFAAGLIHAKNGWYSGRPVMVTRNDYTLGLMNGDLGIAVPAGSPGKNEIRHDSPNHPDRKRLPGPLRVVFPMPDGSLKEIMPSRLNDVQTVYAMTVHKAQGSEFEHVALVLPDRFNPVLTRELLYTGITRARKWFTLVASDMHLAARAAARRTHRASGLGDLLHQERPVPPTL